MPLNFPRVGFGTYVLHATPPSYMDEKELKTHGQSIKRRLNPYGVQVSYTQPTKDTYDITIKAKDPNVESSAVAVCKAFLIRHSIPFEDKKD